MLVNISVQKRTCDTVQVFPSITKRITYFSFEKIENRFKLFSTEDLKKLSDNAENFWKIPIKHFCVCFYKV